MWIMCTHTPRCLRRHQWFDHEVYETLEHHKERNGVSNYRCLDCFLNRVLRRKSKKTSKFRFTGLCVREIYRWPVNSRHKGPVTRKMFPFDDVIMKFPSPALPAINNLHHVNGVHNIQWHSIRNRSICFVIKTSLGFHCCDAIAIMYWFAQHLGAK